MATIIITLLQAQQKQNLIKCKIFIEMCPVLFLFRNEKMSNLNKGTNLAEKYIEQNIDIKLDEIAGLEEQKNILKENVILPCLFSEVFKGDQRYDRKIFLFGVNYISFLNFDPNFLPISNPYF